MRAVARDDKVKVRFPHQGNYIRVNKKRGDETRIGFKQSPPSKSLLDDDEDLGIGGSRFETELTKSMAVMSEKYDSVAKSAS